MAYWPMSRRCRRVVEEGRTPGGGWLGLKGRDACKGVELGLEFRRWQIIFSMSCGNWHRQLAEGKHDGKNGIDSRVWKARAPRSQACHRQKAPLRAHWFRRCRLLMMDSPSLGTNSSPIDGSTSTPTTVATMDEHPPQSSQQGVQRQAGATTQQPGASDAVGQDRAMEIG